MLRKMFDEAAQKGVETLLDVVDTVIGAFTKITYDWAIGEISIDIFFSDAENSWENDLINTYNFDRNDFKSDDDFKDFVEAYTDFEV